MHWGIVTHCLVDEPLIETAASKQQIEDAPQGPVDAVASVGGRRFTLQTPWKLLGFTGAMAIFGPWERRPSATSLR